MVADGGMNRDEFLQISAATEPLHGAFSSSIWPLTELPELGQLDRRRIAALVGLAPVARDSGQMKGRRMIRGGRSTLRTLLYIAALHASRFSETFGRFRRRLTDAGKPIKVVLTATAHKLLGVLNAMIANKQDFRFDPSG